MFRLLLILLPCACFCSVQEDVDNAFKWYRQGERATETAERQQAFNEALASFARLESLSEQPSGSLLYNIGNSYYQLGEYPWAIVYYERAARLLPRNDRVFANLNEARAKLALASSTDQQPSKYATSHSEKMRLFVIVLLVATLLASAALWFRIRPLMKVAVAVACISLIPLLGAVAVNFFSSIDAVLIQASPLYRDAGAHYAYVTEQPVTAGTKVLVLEVVDEGKWLKVSTASNKIGFLPYEVARII